MSASILQNSNDARGEPDRAAQALRARWSALQAQQSLRNRDAARALGVSEGELIASRVAHGNIRLAATPLALLQAAEPLGRVLALTRNEAAVHEKDGVYTNVSATGHVGLALGEEIDLRMFFNHWCHAFACDDGSSKATGRSLQFFDATGEAVHKIFLRDGSDRAAYDALVERFADIDQTPGIAVDPPPAPSPPIADQCVDIERFQAGWAGLTDTHEFFPLLKRHQVGRLQALRLAPADHAYPVAPDAAQPLLEAVAASGLPIMVFVGSTGCIQIHTGPVRNVKVMGDWLNVLDAGFNLHLRQPLVAQSWVVRKPTRDGVVTSLELFDREGELIAMFFGQRKPGQSEMADWRTIIAALPAHVGAVA
jgi:putative hemin transport protein